MTNATCHLCGEKLDGRVCPTCGEREMTDAELHHVVGGMGVAGYIGIGLGIIRLIQGRAIRREMMRRN